MKDYRNGIINKMMVSMLAICMLLLVLDVIIFKNREDRRLNFAETSAKSADLTRDKITLIFDTFCDACIKRQEKEIIIAEDDKGHLIYDNYDVLHMSMWNSPKLDDGTYEKFWGKTIYYPQHNFSTPLEWGEYMDCFSQNEIVASKVYISVDPYALFLNYCNYTYYDEETMTYEEYLAKYVFCYFDKCQSTNFVIVLPTFSLEHINNNMAEFEDIMSSWYSFLMLLRWWDNVSVQYDGAEEWLITNINNFTSNYELVDEVGKLEITYIYSEDRYQITPPELLEKKKSIEQMCVDWRNEERTCFKNKKIVFYGDSLFDYYKESTLAIPGIIQGMTGADCYNLSIGGTTASQRVGNSFAEVAASGVGRDGDRFENEVNPSDDVIFVVLYGVNDYLLETPIDEVALGLFEGAESLISEYPNSKILFVAPYRIADQDKEIDYDSYVDAVRDVARGYHLPFLNLYEEIEIDADNSGEMLVDGIHPTLEMNVEIAKLITSKILE